MALLNAKLYVKRNGEAAVPCNLYSTTEEVGGEYVTVTASNTKAYAKLGGTSDAFCTQGRVKKGTNTYAILSQAKPAYNKVEYRTPGTYTFTFPVGVTTAKSTVAGAGGGGAGNEWINEAPIAPGGNGGSGELITKNISVTPLSTLTIIVGSGGAGGSYWGYPGRAGDSSSIVNFVTARGGGGGLKENKNGTSYGNGGAGGLGGKRTDRGDDGKAGSPGWVIIEYGGDI